MGFWNWLNPTIAMAGHLSRQSTSTIGTTTPPNIYVWGKLQNHRLEDAGMRQNKMK